MHNSKKILTLFFLVIILIALFLFVYKDKLATYMQEKIQSDSALFLDTQLPNVDTSKNSEALNTESMSESKFRALKKQVPDSYIETSISTSTTNSNQELFKTP